MIRNVKADIDRELAAGEIKDKVLGKEETESLTDLLADTKELAEEVRCNFRLDASGQIDARHHTTPKQDSEDKTARETPTTRHTGE